MHQGRNAAAASGELAAYLENHLPSDKQDPTPDQAQRALILACKIFDAVLARLPEEAQLRVLQ